MRFCKVENAVFLCGAPVGCCMQNTEGVYIYSDYVEGENKNLTLSGITGQRRMMWE